MSLLQDASLCLTPSAYKEGKLYSVIPSNGNGDFTGTRATTATRVNSSGLIETAAINMIRRDYSLGSCPNILLEPQRTNLALQSSSFDSVTWIKSSTIVTANSTTSPSGVVDADTITTSSTFNNIFQGVSVLANTTYTFSFWALRGTMTDLKYSVYNVSGTSNIIAPTSYYSQTNSSTWSRIVVTFTTPVGCTLINIYPIRDTGATGTCFLWGTQLEAGAYATSFIPTTNASVTRNADIITRNNIFTNGLITAAGGTWFVELRNNRVLIRDGFQNGISLDDSSFANAIRIAVLSTGRVSILLNWGGTNSTPFTTTSDNCKLALKFNGSTMDIFQNGVKVVNGTTFAPNFSLMQLLRTSSISTPYFINEMDLFPTPLTDAQMSMLTSGIYPTAAAAYASLGLVSESPSCLTSTTTF